MKERNQIYKKITHETQNINKKSMTIKTKKISSLEAQCVVIMTIKDTGDYFKTRIENT